MNVVSDGKYPAFVGELDGKRESFFWGCVSWAYSSIPIVMVATLITIMVFSAMYRSETSQTRKEQFLEKLEFVRDRNTGLCYAKYQGSLALVPEDNIHASIRSVTLDGMEYVKDPASGLCFAKHRDVITVVPEEKVKHLLILPKEEKRSEAIHYASDQNTAKGYTCGGAFLFSIFTLDKKIIICNNLPFGYFWMFFVYSINGGVLCFSLA